MRLLPIALLLVQGALPLAAETVALHPGISAQGIDPERVTSILLGRISCWADGTPVIVVVSLEASADAAVSSLLGRDTERLLRGWKRLVYAGGAAMPTIAHTNAEALALVARLPGAIALLPEVPAASGCTAVELRRTPR